MAVTSIKAIKLITNRELRDLDIGHKHPIDRWTENKIDYLPGFEDHFNIGIGALRGNIIKRITQLDAEP